MLINADGSYLTGKWDGDSKGQNGSFTGVAGDKTNSTQSAAQGSSGGSANRSTTAGPVKSVNLTAQDIEKSYAVGIGNSITQGLANFGDSFRDGGLTLEEKQSAGLSPTIWKPFSNGGKADWIEAEGEATGNGYQAVLGGRGIGKGLSGLATEDVALSARADAVHGVLDPIAAGQRTTAAMVTVEGARVIASGGRDLTPAQRAALLPGEVAAKLPGAHAEVTLLNHATRNGLTPAEMAVTRKICAACQAAIEQSGGKLTSPTTATWSR